MRTSWTLLSLLIASSAVADEPLPPDLKPYARDMPVVVVKSNRDVDLDYLEDDQEFEVAALGMPVFTISSDRWKVACESPCNERVYRRSALRISCDGILISEPFTLPKKGNRILLEVSAGSLPVRRAGWATLAIGAPLAGFGALALVLVSVTGSPDPSNPYFTGSLVPTLFGVSLAITSIPLLVKSRTVVTAQTL